MGERLDSGRRYANAGRVLSLELISGRLAAKVEGNYKPFYNWERPAATKLSGKSRLLVTFLQEILTNREKVLIFSQYVETLDCIRLIIKKEPGEAALIYPRRTWAKRPLEYCSSISE